MKRVAGQYLTEWLKRPHRKPLVLRGARQVGKTYLVENWGREHFEFVLRLDLEREHDLHPLFSYKDPERLINELSLLKKRPIIKGKTLLFLDEIQACPAALEMLRYFYELMPGLHVVAAGSLLEFGLKEISHSMPVGRIEYLYLYPMSFEEFLLATEEDGLADHLKSLSFGQKISEPLNTTFLEILRKYFFIGGMPEAVYAATQQAPFLEIQRIQSSILQTMQDDFAKYGTHQQQSLLRRNFRYFAMNVGHKIKYVNISRENRTGEIKNALELLTQSRVVHFIHHTSANGIPLGAEKNERHFKGLFLDIGLVNHMCGLTLVLPEKLLTVNEGSLAEQFVGQQLLGEGPPFQSTELFYWHREAKNANAEVDYLISRNQEIIPIEVKAGSNKEMRSVHQFLIEKKRNKAIRFYLGDLRFESLQHPSASSGEPLKLLSLPLYLVNQLNRFLPVFDE